jgi:hypothetical protein
MKYALINSQTKRIIRINDNNNDPINDNLEFVSVSDAIESEFNSSSRKVLFLIDGSIKTMEQKHWINNPESVKNNIRKIRNSLLRNSDWTQLPDSPLNSETKALWATYRQTLRDITENIDENGEVTYPDTP